MERYLASRSTWPPPKPNEQSHANKALMKDALVLFGIIYCMYYASNKITNEITEEHTNLVINPTQQWWSLLTAIAMVITFSADMFLLPHPSPDEPKWQTIAIIGHSGFFTIQTLFLQTCYHVVKCYALFTGNIKLAIVCYAISLWVNTQGAALTLLFFKLNWYEPKWQRDIQKPMEKKYPGISFPWLLGHVPSLPIALVDAIFVTNGLVVAAHGAEHMTVVKIAYSYGFLYLLFCKYIQWQFDSLIYPFIKDIAGPVKCIGFVVIVGSAVSICAYILNILMLL